MKPDIPQGPEFKKILDAHHAFMVPYFEAGKILTSGPLVGGRGIHINELPLLARGGVLEKGQVGLLEGSGAEAVVPLENNAAWVRAVARDMAREMGTGMTLNVTVNAAAGQSETAIANMVMAKIQQAVNRKGAVFA